MYGTATTTLYPLHRCKTLHLVRHAQGIHNAEGDKDPSAYLSPALFDAHLTPLGWQQVDNLRKHVNSCGLAKKIQLVVTSPLLRTMQTAVGVFGGDDYVDGTDGAPLMVANLGNSTRSAISSLNVPPFIAVELCREHMGVHPCDKRRSIKEYQTMFPAIDFSLIENDEDILWEADVREPIEDVLARGLMFIDWLCTREEKEIAIVTHGGLLYHLMNSLGKDCNSLVTEEMREFFANCELRSMVIIDKKSIGSAGLSTTNFLGKVLPGLDLLSEIAHEKHPEKESDMDGTASTTLYPLHRCKTVHLVRHAEAIHNEEGLKDNSAYLSPALFDAHLTPLGWEQVDNMHKHVNSSGLAKKIELVIVSPLLRAMQTAVGVFGGEGYVDGTDGTPLMMENLGNNTRSTISSLNAPPFLAVELCRAHILGNHPCAKRKSVKEYQTIFPAIYFSLIENDEDILWKAGVTEPNEHVAARGLKFFDWLWTREEKEIAVVTHSGFLIHTMSTFGKDCNPLVKEEISKHFANCELRSMVVVDRKSIGSDPSTTNFSGNIPPGGIDLPSDTAHVKHPEKGVPNSSA